MKKAVLMLVDTAQHGVRETLRMSGPRRGHPDEERGTENPHFLVLLPVPGSLTGTGLSVEVLPELHFPEVECCSPSVLLTHGLCFSTLWAYSRAALPGSCVSLGPWECFYSLSYEGR